MTAIGKRLRRFLTKPRDGDDLYFLELEGLVLEVWVKGWHELARPPEGTSELALPAFAAGQEIVRLRAHDYPGDGTVVTFANGAALVVYFHPFTDDDGQVHTVYELVDPAAAAETYEPALAEIADTVVQEEPAPA